MAQVIVYIDGFNLYYGAVKNTPYKWLDLSQLCARMLPHDIILQIKYFTAKVSGRTHDPDNHLRQERYFRALKTIPNLKIVMGRFVTRAKRLPLSGSNPTRLVWVDVTEEKGSDVNIAAHIVHDAARRLFEVAVIISNDADLLEPLKIVKQDFGLHVGILNPHEVHPTVLKPHATFIKRIRQADVAACQFADVLADSRGSIHKPSTW